MLVTILSFGGRRDFVGYTGVHPILLMVQKSGEKTHRLDVFQTPVVNNGTEPWKKPGCLGYIGDYTTQLYRDYNKPL